MWRAIGFGIVAFLGVLGAMMGHKMSSEAMAVVVGVFMGVLASIPMSVLLIVLLRKSMQNQQPSQSPQQTHYPPVFVIGQQPQPLPGPRRQEPWIDGQWKPASDTPQFKVLGED